MRALTVVPGLGARRLAARVLRQAGVDNGGRIAAATRGRGREAAERRIVVTGSRIQVGNVEAMRRAQRRIVPAPPAATAAACSAGCATIQAIWTAACTGCGRDKFTDVAENAFKIVREAPVSTFSIDVDTASYSLRPRLAQPRTCCRSRPRCGPRRWSTISPTTTPPPRRAAQPFSTNVAVFPSPWTPGRKLVRIGIKGYAVQRATRPRANLVFLIDTSGSMDAPNKLPLVKQSLAHAARRAGRRATRSRSSPMPATPAPRSSRPRRARSAKIRAVIDQLGAGGSTAGAEGIRQAYALAEAQLRPERRQPRDPGDRRRLQRRHHRPGRAQGLYRARARQGRVPLACSASAWAITTTR